TDSTYTTSGIVDSITISGGGVCDTVLRLNFTVTTRQYRDTTVSACESYVWNRTGLSYTTSGIVDSVIISGGGVCDTVLRLNLTVSTGQYRDTTVSACESYIWDRTGLSYSASGVVDSVIISGGGACDTIVRLILTIDNVQYIDTAVSACESYVWDRTGLSYTASGVVDSVTVSGGVACDTVLRL